MNHSYITEKINKKMGNLFSEDVLNTLDRIDTGFDYDIRIIGSLYDFFNTYRRRVTKFRNSEGIITTSTVTDNYIIYKAASLNVVQGVVDETYTCDSNNNHTYTIKPTTYNGKGFIIFISEKVSKELNNIVHIDRVINIALL